MNHHEQIEIPLSKRKMILTLLGACVFVVLGGLFVLNPQKFTSIIMRNPIVILISGIASILFFGIVGISIFRKLLDKKPGLIINHEGVNDNSSGVSAGFIPWSDIREIKVSHVFNQKFLLFIVNNPEDYLDKIKNPLKRSAMKMNYKSYGSPISISSTVLQTNFDDLSKVLVEKLKTYKQ
ncbi:STM3941 family protein [Sphingobacterium lactis]|uniref:Uncharacterized protein n=1 Tax=Sphingobacterium lactis TaxID=797291 RepID=A0A1H5WYM0_9SPHI|nr:STM3941 family protein [Sphingobacterium lactis]SEG04355.1 hypothetical protein SAMN05421877_104204 [Sphingobacterium lactis]